MSIQQYTATMQTTSLLVMAKCRKMHDTYNLFNIDRCSILVCIYSTKLSQYEALAICPRSKTSSHTLALVLSSMYVLVDY